MRFRHLLDRVRRVWRWSVVVAIVFCIAPLFAPTILFSFVHPGGMQDLRGGHRYLDPSDAFNWAVWLLYTGQFGGLASWAIALATGATYVICKRLPDYTDSVTPPWPTLQTESYLRAKTSQGQAGG